MRGALRLKAGAGDVGGTVFSEDAEVKVGAGDLDLSWLAAPEKGRVSVKAGCGDATLVFPAGTRLRSRLKSGFGGAVCQFDDEPDAVFEVPVTVGMGDAAVKKAKAGAKGRGRG